MNQQDQTFYNILLRIEGKLGGIENELKGHKDTHIEIKKLLDKKDETLTNHDTRIKSVEDFRAGIRTKVGVIATIFSGLGVLSMDFIKKVINQL